MKLIWISFVLFVTGSWAESVSPFLTNPDFIFGGARDYQLRVDALQSEINEVTAEVQTTISSVLEKSTTETLGQYQEVGQQIDVMYESSLERYGTLTPGLCKSNAEAILNSTTTFAGFEISNCASYYDRSVQIDLDIARRALNGADEFYTQIQMIIVKSFIGKNIFTDPEDIKDLFIAMFERVATNWESSKPEFEGIRDSLETGIATQNRNLDVCHERVITLTSTFYELFRSQVETCIEFERTPEPFGKSKSTKPDIEKYLKLFEEKLANVKPFEWPERS
ncbi:CLUMA_CG003966, isoform A [Clunio marinus]|uniref:CLUMA_CG003966, isoform A n=1 Tax=Clunio marinus TaxID=568069 RepID=A0A1J1HQD4_9DIPT|nr:CLUMA_CG003966, isoform A [Clunio marinus]